MPIDMTPPHGLQSGSEVSRPISFDTEYEIRNVYGFFTKGKIIDNLKESFRGSIFGVFQDKFGKVGMLNYENKT